MNLDAQAVALLVYSVFLLIILAINLLYLFQVFKYRLPGDASIPILLLHSMLIVVILVGSSVYLMVEI